MSKEEKDAYEEIGLEPQAFEALEREFQDVLQELAGDPSLERFRTQYEALHRALLKSHENEKKLLKKCKELNSDIVGNASKVQVALKMTQEDSHTIALLKNEIEKTYRMLELSKEREERNKQKIENLHSEIRHLQSLIDQGNNISSGQSNTVNELLLVKEELTKERDNLSVKFSTVTAELEVSAAKVKTYESERLTMETENKSLKKTVNELQERQQKNDDRNKKFQEELEQIKQNYEATKKEVERTNDDKTNLQNQLAGKIKELTDKENEKKILVQNKADLNKRIGDLTGHLENERQRSEHILELKAEIEQSLSSVRKELQEKTTSVNTLTRERNKLVKDNKNLETTIDELERMKELTKNSIHQLEHEIDDARKLAFEDRKTIDDLKRDRDLLQKDITRAESNNRKQGDIVIGKSNELQEKEKEVLALKKEVDLLNKKITFLDKDKEKYGIQAAQANAKYFHSLEEIKLKDNLISEFQKKNLETEAKLKQQQNLYEAVRADRNLYSKNLTETQDEIAEMKKKHRIVTHQINQLKEEIEAKEAALTKEHFDFKNAEKKIEEYSKMLEANKTELKAKEEKIKNYDMEISKMKFIIKEIEQQRIKLKEDYEFVKADRDMFGAQLIRRNDELALLYEKIKVQQAALAKGEAQYRERLADIELLKIKIADLMREQRIYKKQSDKIPDLKNEIHNLQRELIDEKMKVKALSEELENPMNVHRWRKLEGTDSDQYEMITKIQKLQKRLIQKTEEVVEKEMLVQQKEKTINELREIMKRQPGVDEAKMISTYQQSLRQKTRQMKAMAAELNMYQAQVNEYKYEIDRLNRELQEIKTRYYEVRRREQNNKEVNAANQNGMVISLNLPQQKYMGGGYNLANP